MSVAQWPSELPETARKKRRVDGDIRLDTAANSRCLPTTVTTTATGTAAPTPAAENYLQKT